MSFIDLQTTRKGTLGEQLVKPLLESFGFQLHPPSNDSKPHLIDYLGTNRETHDIIAVDVKTKAKRFQYDDSGIDYADYLTYTDVSKKHNMKVFLFFIDDVNGMCYGNFLHNLDQPIICTTTGSYSYNMRYPLTSNGIVYWPLSKMKFICTLTAEQCQELVAYNIDSPVQNPNRTKAILGTQC